MHSLLDIVVFGRAAALRAVEIVRPNAPHKPLPAAAGDAAVARLDRIRNAGGGTRTARSGWPCSARCRITAPCSAPPAVLEEGFIDR